MNLQQSKALADRLVTNRGPYEGLIEDVQELTMPWRGDVTGDWGPATERQNPCFDPVGVVSLHMLASYLQGSIFSNNTDWLRLDDPTGSTPQAELDGAAIEVLAALDDSNFYTAAGQVLRDMAAIGNATLLVEPRPDRLQPDGSTFGGLDFEAVPFASVYRKLDRMGRPLAILRKFELWPEEALEFFGHDVCSHDDEGKVKLCNLIKRDGSAYTSYWWAQGGEDYATPPVELDYCPYICGMWDQTDGHDYGYGIGHQVRPALAGLQELARETIQAVGRDLNPLLMAESDSFADLDVGQNGIVTVKRGIAMRPEFLRSESNFAAADQIRRQDVESVRQAFFIDALMGPETQERSAEATRARQATLATRMAGPAQRISLYLSDVVASVMGAIARRGGLGGISGPVRPVFVSPFFANAKMSAVDRVNTFVSQQAQIAALLQNPELLDAVDMDAVAATVAELSDIPHGILRAPEAMAAMKEKRAAEAADARINAAAQAGTLQQPGLEAQIDLGRNLPGVG